MTIRFINKVGSVFLLLFICAGTIFSLSGCSDRKHPKAVQISDIQDLNSPHFKIGVMTGVLATQKAQSRFSQAQFMEYSMPIDAFTAICSGKIDAVVLDRPTLEFMSLAHPELVVMNQDLAIGRISVAAAKKNTALMRQVNAFIREYRKDGTYRQMYDRWFRSSGAEMPYIPKIWNQAVPLKVGVTANNEPLCFIKNGKMAGFDSEFSLRLGAYLKRKVEFVDLPYDALVISLQSGKIDLAIAFMDAMPEREESVLFSDYYIDAPITVLVRKDIWKGRKKSKISNLQDLNDPIWTIGIQSETLAAQKAKQILPAAKHMEFINPPDCYVALSAGKIDAFVYDRPALEYAAIDRLDFWVLPENLAVGCISVGATKQNTKLIQKVDEFIRQYRKDGTYQEMYKRWVLSPNSNMPEIAEPRNPDGNLVIGVDPVNPPMCFIKDKKETGFDIEFSKRLALFINKRIEFKAIPFDGLIPALKGYKIDLAIAQMDATQERKESILFSTAYIDSSIAAMIRKKDYAGGLMVRKNADRSESGSGIQWFRNTVKSLAESFDKTFIRENRWKLILQGLSTTIVITFFAVLFGTLLAFPLCMMCRSKRKILVWLGERYISLIMGTPILVILMILYYVIFAKVDINGIVVAVIAFAMDFSAYTSVTLRSGIDGIPYGQTEAALALGHTPTAAFFRFVLPQAVRTILPVYRGEIISTLKATSVVGYIAVMDLTKMGDIIRSRTYEAFFPLIAIALIYFLTAKCLTAILLVLENQLNPDIRRSRLQKRGIQ